jgi:hypothetical protein
VQNDLNNKQVCPCWIKHQDKMSIVLSITVVWANLDTDCIMWDALMWCQHIEHIMCWCADVLNVLTQFQHCWTYHMLMHWHVDALSTCWTCHVLRCWVAWINMMSTRWTDYVQHVFNNYSKVDVWMCQQCIMHMFLRVGHIITMSKYIGMYDVHATAGAAVAGGTSHDVTCASKGRCRIIEKWFDIGGGN